MFLLEQQYALNAKVFSVINFLISLFIQGRSLIITNNCFMWNKILHYLEQRFGEEVNLFINFNTRQGS